MTRARGALKRACKKNAELPPPQVILAEFFRVNNILAGMRNYLEQAVKEYPNDPQAYVVLAGLAMGDCRITEARLLYEKANSLMPGFTVAKRKKDLQPQILAGMAMTSEAREDWPGAQQKIEAWLQLDPKSIQAMEELAQCMLRQKNVQGALEVLVKANKAADDKLKEDNEKLKPGEEKRTDNGVLSPEATVAKFYAITGDQEKAQEWMNTAINARQRDLRLVCLPPNGRFDQEDSPWRKNRRRPPCSLTRTRCKP